MSSQRSDWREPSPRQPLTNGTRTSNQTTRRPDKTPDTSPEYQSWEQICVAGLTSIPIFSRASLALQILTQTDQPFLVTDDGFSAELNNVIDPQPFSRRFLGRIRSMSNTVSNQPVIEIPRHELWGARLNCFSHFLNGNGSGNRKWYQEMKQESSHGTKTGRSGNSCLPWI